MICKSQHTLRQSLMRVKSTRPDNRKKGVVYEVPCADCDSVYIGETEAGRSLEMRLKEHKYAVKTYDTNNGVAVHAWDNDHHVNWDATRVVAVEHHLTKRRVLESLHIREQRKTSNLESGYILSPTWRPLLT